MMDNILLFILYLFGSVLGVIFFMFPVTYAAVWIAKAFNRKNPDYRPGKGIMTVEIIMLSYIAMGWGMIMNVTGRPLSAGMEPGAYNAVAITGLLLCAVIAVNVRKWIGRLKLLHELGRNQLFAQVIVGFIVACFWFLIWDSF